MMVHATDDTTSLTLTVAQRGEHWYVLNLPDEWQEPDTLLLIVNADKSLTPIDDSHTMREALADLWSWHPGLQLMRQRQAIHFETPYGTFRGAGSHIHPY